MLQGCQLGLSPFRGGFQKELQNDLLVLSLCLQVTTQITEPFSIWQVIREIGFM
jgi:hypothetical protein